MNRPGTESVTRRLDRVERDNRRLKLAVGMLMAGLGAMTLLGAAGRHGPVIEAEQFIVKDDAGRLRLALGARHQSGLPGLVFYDKDGDANVLLNLGSDESPGLWFYNKDRIRASISLAGDQMRLQMFDKENRIRTSVQIDQDGTPSMKLYDKLEKAIWQAP